MSSMPEVTPRWSLIDERSFLRQSIADAEREHAAGDLDELDFQVLMTRDRQRLSEVEAELACSHQPDEPTSSAGRRQVLLWTVGIAVVAAGLVALAFHLSSSRLPGQSATGSIQLSTAARVSDQLNQATTEVADGNLLEAVKLYHQVLSEDHNQPVALAEAGWLEWEAGTEAANPNTINAGIALVHKALMVDPTFYAPHLFDGTIELRQYDDAAQAVVQYRAFLADHPPRALVVAAASELRAAFSAAGQPLPAGVPTS